MVESMVVTVVAAKNLQKQENALGQFTLQKHLKVT
jgi:hypothetical protein